MGRVAEFSDDEIIDAGNQLLNSNKVVTPFGIRQIIGGGSAARIKMVWNSELERRSNEVSQNDLDNQVELPAELQDSLEKSIQALTKQLTKAAKDNYQVAIEVAESRVASVIKKHEEKFEEFQQSELEAFQAVDAADKLNENLKSELSTLEKINDDLRQESAKFSGLVESLTSRLEYLDSKLDSKETELMKLVRENAELKGKFETSNLEK
ncbi:DNA-binding protein [Alteromonas naphthalenivorans]|uniref:KfrA N-terminal DNA-binding domain-containing protein n=1 Tax=Alteromonas naphthalenivorans TaxID=715451 RepID=F5Z7H2_ALTNA|nr:DNA-binding protein [Alteromonas naphthalenivorans]AEF03015.1 hypothetical protein ambt_07410 [Alteromonas naphthalenivorans]